uniref:Adhesion G protein-coupled receptor F7 n=1 Tax=Poecilia mexicana TaxID=48701 RepID=A0A3B3XU10_9TELE
MGSCCHYGDLCLLIKKSKSSYLVRILGSTHHILSSLDITCTEPPYGIGLAGHKVWAPCGEGMVGNMTAVCNEDGKYEQKEDNCVLAPIQEMLDKSKVTHSCLLSLHQNTIKKILISVECNICIFIFNFSKEKSIILHPVMFLISISDFNISIYGKENQNNNSTIRSTSSALLNLFESVSDNLVNESFAIETSFIQLNKTMFENHFHHDFNFSVEIDIPEASGGSQYITTIVFASMDNVLPPRNEDNSSSMVIKGKVVLAKTAAKIRNISITSGILNDTLKNPKCVFWNFTLFEGLGGWSDWGCSLLSHNNETISCSCNHTTCFSMLMSPEIIEDENINDITIIGVGISMASLVICLITEALTWKKISTNTTAFLRHVSIINIAVSLLIANIWFIIGANITDDIKKKNPALCAAVTFFIHLFYLAMFFWMLASALLLLYRTVFVFEGGLSKTSMLVIGFVLGYAAPLVIAITTMAVTVPSHKYIRESSGCWLNWEDSKALLAFVAPALVIVAINFLILLVVIYKMLSRRAVSNASQAGEQHVLVVIARSLAVLTPFFGLTWSLGIGTIIAPQHKEIHFAFTLCNSLQGGCLFLLPWRSKLREPTNKEGLVSSWDPKFWTPHGKPL